MRQVALTLSLAAVATAVQGQTYEEIPYCHRADSVFLEETWAERTGVRERDAFSRPLAVLARDRVDESRAWVVLSRCVQGLDEIYIQFRSRNDAHAAISNLLVTMDSFEPPLSEQFDHVDGIRIVAVDHRDARRPSCLCDRYDMFVRKN